MFTEARKHLDIIFLIFIVLLGYHLVLKASGKKRGIAGEARFG